jgi:hypothetical protein
VLNCFGERGRSPFLEADPVAARSTGEPEGTGPHVVSGALVSDVRGMVRRPVPGVVLAPRAGSSVHFAM